MARLLLAVCLLAAVVPASLARGLRAPGAGDEGDCQSCIAAVEAAEALLSDPAVETLVVQFFDQKVCPALGDLKKCHNLAQGLVPVVLQWVRSSTSPAGVCSAADYCGNAVALRLADPKTYALALRQQQRVAAADSTECAMCKMVISRVQAALNDTTVQEQVKEEMLKVCQDLPAELAGSCTDFVNTYEPLVTDFINHAQSAQLCAMVGVCMHSLVSEHPLPLTHGMARVLQQLHDVRLTAVVAAAAPAKAGNNNLGDACDVCKMAVLEAHSLVSNPTVQADLVNYTKTVCEQLQNYANVCKSYVDQYAPFVFNLLQQYLQPDLLCSEFGVCKAQPATTATGVVAGAVAQLRDALLTHSMGARATRARTVGLLGPLALQRGDPRHT